MEEELDEIVQHQQDQTQAVQTERHKYVINICDRPAMDADSTEITITLLIVFVR